MDLDQAALHLHHVVVILLCILLVIIEEEEASCLAGVGEADFQNHDGEVGEDWEHVLLCEHTILPALNLSLVIEGVILGDDGVHVPEVVVMGVHEHVQPLQEEIKMRTQSTRSALSDC